MKAIRVEQFGGPEVLLLTDVSMPAPTADQVLVRLHAIGVNPVETYIRSGVYARKPALPYTPGSDAAGIIEAVGANVKNVSVGQRVYVTGSLTGTYAEFALCASTHLHPLPAPLSFAQGAALGIPYATAYRALLQRAQSQPGETVLIHGGSGAVGTAAIQIAVAHRLRVLATAGTARGRELATQQGAHAVFDHHAPDYLDAIRAFTGDQGVDIIIELLANQNLGKDLTLLGQRGRVIVVGSRGRVEIDPRDTMGRDADIRGMVLGNASPTERTAINTALSAGLANGTLRPVVGKTFLLADAAEAHCAVLQPGAYGKIVLTP